MPIDDSALSVAPSPTTDSSPAVPAPKMSVKRWPAALFIVTGLTIASAVFVIHSLCGPESPPVLPSKDGGIHFSETGMNADLFAKWPKDQKPDFVLVITAEMNGYLQKCGCSDPQKGGLERRWNLIQWLKKSAASRFCPSTWATSRHRCVKTPIPTCR